MLILTCTFPHRSIGTWEIELTHDCRCGSRNGKQLTPPQFADPIAQVLRRTVFDGESQSALLLGYTASGKSLVLDRVLRSLAEEAEEAQMRKKRKRQKDAEEGLGGSASASGGSGSGQEPRPPFQAVYLNGMAQANDGMAMREIAEQLGVTATRGGAYSR